MQNVRAGSPGVYPSVEPSGVRVDVRRKPAPVCDQSVSDTNVEGSGAKRDGQRSIEDLEAEMEADHALGTPIPMTIDLF